MNPETRRTSARPASHRGWRAGHGAVDDLNGLAVVVIAAPAPDVVADVGGRRRPLECVSRHVVEPERAARAGVAADLVGALQVATVREIEVGILRRSGPRPARRPRPSRPRAARGRRTAGTRRVSAPRPRRRRSAPGRGASAPRRRACRPPGRSAAASGGAARRARRARGGPRRRRRPAGASACGSRPAATPRGRPAHRALAHRAPPPRQGGARSTGRRSGGPDAPTPSPRRRRARAAGLPRVLREPSARYTCPILPLPTG